MLAAKKSQEAKVYTASKCVHSNGCVELQERIKYIEETMGSSNRRENSRM